MAIQKKTKLGDGVDVDYWKVVGIQFMDYEARTAILWVKGWISKSAKDAGSSEVIAATQKIQVGLAEFDTYFGDGAIKQADKSLISQSYEFLKTTQEKFKGGKDV